MTRKLAVLLLLSVAAAGPLRAQEPDTAAVAAELAGPDLRAAIDGYGADLAALRKRLGIPGLSAAIGREGEILWAAGFGWADREAGVAATAETPYRIASITKTMTAAVVVSLAHEGKLDLDEPVARVLPEGPDWTERVTVRQLLSHTSESDPPGTAFSYSGRYDLLSRVAEAAAGTRFPRLLVRRIIEPAGMRRTYPVSLDSTGTARSVRARLATPYLPDGERANGNMLRDETVGGNGIVSTAPDLVRWASALAAGGVVPDAVREALWSAPVTPTGDTLPYGLGWWVEQTPAVRLVSHGGQWPVYSGVLLHVGGSNLTLAVLANHRAVSSPFYGIGTGTALYSTFVAAFLRRFAVRDLWRGTPPELPWDMSANDLASVVRRYDSDAARQHLGAELFGRGLVAKATGRTARSDSLFRAVVACCRTALRASEDLGLLFHLGRSRDPELRERGREAGRRRLRRMSGDPLARFHLAVSHARAGEARAALPLLRELREQHSEIPTWMWSWSTYLYAEQIVGERPGEARRLLERVLEEGQDEGGLFEEVRALLQEVGGAASDEGTTPWPLHDSPPAEAATSARIVDGDAPVGLPGDRPRPSRPLGVPLVPGGWPAGEGRPGFGGASGPSQCQIDHGGSE